MLDNRSNAYLEAMNGLMQQAKRADKEFRAATKLIAIGYLLISRLKHLPSNPFLRALPKVSVPACRCLLCQV
jgi:transposase